MALSHSSNIITNGLVLCLDAGNRRSYPGTGTAWKDLSGNNNIATLVNGPTFNSYQLGSIEFDGTNDYAVVNSISNITDFTNINNYTVDFWVYMNSLQNDTNFFDNAIIEKWSETAGYPYVFRYIRSSQNIYAAAWNGTVMNTASIQVSYNQWWHICGVFNWSNSILNLYGNGGLVTNSTNLNLTGTISNSSQLNIMRRGNNVLFGTGKLSSLKIYNRALSAQEVKQNYNATRKRFGL